MERITDADRAVFGEMAEIMRCGGGIGLAAPQVGIDRQFVMADIGQGLLILVNPRIVRKRGSAVLEEGCLSLPGVGVDVRRARKIVVSGYNECFEKVSIAAEDLLARVLQHEIDHLRGRLILDYASVFKKFRLKKKLKERLHGVSQPKTQ
ncbi:MAG: peptide deformylase [Deltaproteobacteria bacterium]